MNLLSYIKSVRVELKEVTWPKFEQTLAYSFIIIVISVLVALFLSGVDFGLRSGLEHLLTFAR